MIKRTIRTGLFAVALAVCMTLSAFAANLGGGTVEASALNLRSSASTSASILTTIPRGTSVVVTEQTGNWYKVICNGTEGYISTDYVSLRSELDYNFGTGAISGTNVRMRSGASLTASILGHYNTGSKMAVTGVNGVWYQVSYNGQTGYVHSDYLDLTTTSSSQTKTSSSSSSSSASSEAQNIVDTANQYLGVRYVWGGTSSSGFDCSGLVYYVFNECGYSLNRTAANMYEHGTYVDKADLVAGDLVFFTTSSSGGSIGHVGIYIGDGEFIHSSSGSAKVIISSLSSTYYTDHYYGARRIV